MVTPSYTRTAPRRGAVLLFAGDGVLPWSAAEQMSLGYDAPAVPLRTAPCLTSQGRTTLSAPVYANPLRFRRGDAHIAPPLPLRASAHAGAAIRPPTKKEIPFGISFLRSQDFFLLTYTIPVSDSAALTAYTPTPASKVLGARVFPSSSVSVVEL